MSRLSLQVLASATGNVLTERDRRAAVVPALLCGVIFLAGLAPSFVIALLAG
ncbi:hypothetical protein [Bradyrhizobium murdochi]|uniref:hypothetical protein n=1 Tax=Bradyrhizobium murdochi TaxID=1038859 RepID=UPI00040782CF|nr:hypothetical protein [Bradyrhizobium murdochi]